MRRLARITRRFVSPAKISFVHWERAERCVYDIRWVLWWQHVAHSRWRSETVFARPSGGFETTAYGHATGGMTSRRNGVVSSTLGREKKIYRRFSRGRHETTRTRRVSARSLWPFVASPFTGDLERRAGTGHFYCASFATPRCGGYGRYACAAFVLFFVCILTVFGERDDFQNFSVTRKYLQK